MDNPQSSPAGGRPFVQSSQAASTAFGNVAVSQLLGVLYRGKRIKLFFFFRKKQSDLMTLVMFKKQEVVPLTVYVCYEDFYMHNHGFFS